MHEVVDDLGEVLAMPDGPARIVSLVPSLSELLVVWGLEDRVMAVTDWCVAPPGSFAHADRVRGTKNPDVAAIIDLAPTLVLTNEEENREIDVRRLRAAGIAVYVTRVRTVADAAASVRRLGEVLDVPQRGGRLAQELGAVAGQPPALSVPALCPIWRDPWMVVGSDTFAGDVLACSGARVWHPPHDRRYPRVELAEARAAGVRLVLLPDEPYPFTDDDRGAFADWPARVHLIDGAALTWWGPRTPAAIRSLSRLVAEVGDAQG